MSITVDIKGQPVELLDTRELAIFHNKTTKVSTWILDTFFPNRPVFTGNKVAMGELDTNTPIAPLVAPSVQGRIITDKAEYNVQYVRPAYLKPSGYVTPQNVNDLALLGTMQTAGLVNTATNMSGAEKLRVAQIARFQRNRESITNFNIFMALEVLLKGKVTFASQDFPEVTVDYGRHSDLNFAPLTTWDAVGAKPVSDIKAMNALLSEHGGTDGRVVLSSSKVFGAFANTDEYKDNFVKAQGANAASPLNVGSLGGGNQEAKYRGELDGVAWWTLDATYRDENGAVKRYIGDKAFYLIADMNGSLCHCGLQNLDVMDQPLDVYDYIVQEKDPSGIKLISESSPLAAPSIVNGVVGGDAFIA